MIEFELIEYLTHIIVCFGCGLIWGWIIWSKEKAK